MKSPIQIVLLMLLSILLVGCDVFVDCELADLEWISIAGGEYKMGSDAGDSSELPVHNVSVSDFEMLKTEVTVAQFAQCYFDDRCHSEHYRLNSETASCNLGHSQKGNYPMNCINWYGAEEFCKWAGGRLPSEAEWEYAARSEGKEREYPWGDEAATCEYAVMGNGCDRGKTWPVCSIPKGNTEQGLCDMSGNIKEWVADCWHNNYTDAPKDGSVWATGEDLKVLRGGSWYDDDVDDLRASSRAGGGPTDWSSRIGFRCVRSSP